VLPLIIVPPHVKSLVVDWFTASRYCRMGDGPTEIEK